MTIPIQNIYYLLCYAWNQLEEGQVVDVDTLQSTELADLFARVLDSGINHLLRRGLDRGYRSMSEDTARLRGRIDFGVSLKRMLPPRARAHCRFDELDHDVLHNRILKTTLRRLAYVQGLDAKLRTKLLLLHRRFANISETPLNRLTFRRVQLHSNNAFYRFLMNVCELVQRSVFLNETVGAHQFRDFMRDDKAMARVFEHFVFNFYKREQNTYAVARNIISWDLEAPDEESRSLLPQMKTDISLRAPGRTIIIDTKYYSHTLQTHYGKESFHSAHLFQMFAYLKNLEKDAGSDASAEGILLYPTVSKPLDYTYKMPGHVLRICTINLAQEWQGIHRDLLELVNRFTS